MNMKHFLSTFMVFFALLFFSGFVGAEETNCQEGLENCQYINKSVYEVIDTTTQQAVDRVTHERLIPLKYSEAMALRYVELHRQVESGAEVFLKILQSGDPSAEKVLEQVAPQRSNTRYSIISS